MAKTEAAIYVAKEAFLLNGDQLVPAGATVAAGHPILKKREHLFEAFKPMFDVEPETAKAAAKGSSGPSEGLAAHQALVARAKELGLPAKGKNAELEAAIAVAEADQAAAEQAAAAKASAEAQGAPADAGGGDA